ncbi:DUF3040 domain-containing protein [Leifsonia sp. Leaf264]|uniref:DUF3040 domain-containing protein n=1 Tax=Leifsonia sp. Leaf264 TaxID=1736314 RepID=UPI0006F3B909|nr:DUF3040 domain-containing protein [Leifsonia sp. Leaf264]KQO99749.1 hypothetical protein ASF30_07570 [Leifsonia sp. Leaf264]
MPLSEQEQRLLDEMERSLYHNDADFVATVGAPRGRPNYRAIVLGVLLAVAGLAALIAGVAVDLLIVGIGGFILMFIGVLVAITPSKRAAAPEELPTSSKPKKAASADRGFMDRLNDRWDHRQDGQD